MTNIAVQQDPMTFQLPYWVDTNEVYYLVRPDGRRYPVLWDPYNNKWDWIPF